MGFQSGTSCGHKRGQIPVNDTVCKDRNDVSEADCNEHNGTIVWCNTENNDTIIGMKKISILS